MQKTASERTELIIGLVVIAVTLALVGWLIVFVRGNIARSMAVQMGGKIVASGESVRGKEQTFTYMPPAEVTDGAPVAWKIDGEMISESVYEQGVPLTLNYTPTVAGKHCVTATVGRYSQLYEFDAAAPKLTLSAPNITVVYGEDLPELTYTTAGFVANEEQEFCFDGKCVVDCSDKLNAGVYRIVWDKQCNFLDYETDYVYGTLTVLPKQLSVDETFVKTYDATNRLNAAVHLEGIADGDDVTARCDNLYFDNKNVGEHKRVMLSNVALEGADAANYVLPDFADGKIVPKEIRLEGLTVKNKIYDGTTKADIDKLGKLTGVCEGDSLAIGNIDARFDNAEAGLRVAYVKSVTLVGADKDNYVVTVPDCQAQIEENTTFWDKILQKQPIC